MSREGPAESGLPGCNCLRDPLQPRVKGTKYLDFAAPWTISAISAPLTSAKDEGRLGASSPGRRCAAPGVQRCRGGSDHRFWEAKAAESGQRFLSLRIALGLCLRAVEVFFQPTGYTSPLLKARLGTEGLWPRNSSLLLQREPGSAGQRTQSLPQQSPRAACRRADPSRCSWIGSAWSAFCSLFGFLADAFAFSFGPKVGFGF